MAIEIGGGITIGGGISISSGGGGGGGGGTYSVMEASLISSGGIYSLTIMLASNTAEPWPTLVNLAPGSTIVLDISGYGNANVVTTNASTNNGFNTITFDPVTTDFPYSGASAFTITIL